MPSDNTSTAEWLTSLRSAGPERDRAHARLYELLLRAARAELHRRSGQFTVTGAELDDLAHQAAADAMVGILGKLDTFRGESRFTTWAYKFAVFEVSAKVGRHFWRVQPTVPLDDAGWDRLPARFGISAEHESEGRELVEALRHALDNDLSDRQRRLFTAIVLEGVSLDTLCVDLNTNRNAIYKSLFDARRRLRAALVAKGLLEGNGS